MKFYQLLIIAFFMQPNISLAEENAIDCTLGTYSEKEQGEYRGYFLESRLKDMNISKTCMGSLIEKALLDFGYNQKEAEFYSKAFKGGGVEKIDNAIKVTQRIMTDFDYSLSLNRDTNNKYYQISLIENGYELNNLIKNESIEIITVFRN